MPTHTPMYYREHEPRPELKPWVAAHWEFRVEPGAGVIEHWIPLTGGALLGMRVGAPPMLWGPRTSPLRTEVAGGLVVWGSHLWPGAAGSLLGAAADGLVERQAPAGRVVGDAWAAALTAELAAAGDEDAARAVLDAALLSLVPGAEPLDEQVMTVVFHILRAGGEAPVAELATSVGLSPRQLRRRFRAVVGLTAKELCRIQRLRSAAVAAVVHRLSPWVEVAAEHGYADQAHLVREFRNLLGLSPTGFEGHVRRIHHGGLVR